MQHVRGSNKRTKAKRKFTMHRNMKMKYFVLLLQKMDSEMLGGSFDPRRPEVITLCGVLPVIRQFAEVMWRELNMHTIC